MRKIKLSEKKMKHSKRGRENKTVIKGRVVLRDEKPTAEAVIVKRANLHGNESDIPRFQVKKTITEAQKKKVGTFWY